MKAVIVLNHIPTDEMIKDLKENYNVDEIINLKIVAPDIMQKFSNIPFEKEQMLEIASDIYACVMQYIPDMVIIAGEPRVCRIIVNTLSYDRIPCYSPYSKRESQDIKQSDGSIKKVSTFKYIGLAEY